MSGAAPLLRPARADEAEALARLHVAVWRATYRDYATPEAVALLDEARRLPAWQAALGAQTPGAAVWVAARDGAILGVVSVAPSAHPAFGGRLEIKHLYVALEAQGQGIGRRLLAHVLDSAGPGGVALAVVRQNAPARAFYARMGGQEIGAFTDPGPLWRSDNIVVAWD